LRLRIQGEWFDYDLDFFRDVALPLDHALDHFDEVARADFSIADGLDYPLRHENLIGIGLVAAQLYLVSVAAQHSVSRRQALSVGPRHSSGMPLAELINHGANLWKHADEWNWDALESRQAKTLAAFDEIGIADGDLSLYRLLSEVTGLNRPRLMDVALILERWHNALDEVLQKEPGES
jgi:hypothetical protein